MASDPALNIILCKKASAIINYNPWVFCFEIQNNHQMHLFLYRVLIDSFLANEIPFNNNQKKILQNVAVCWRK